MREETKRLLEPLLLLGRGLLLVGALLGILPLLGSGMTTSETLGMISAGVLGYIIAKSFG